MSRSERQRYDEIKQKISHKLTDLTRTGYWFCLSCQKITKLDLEGNFNRCYICQSARVRWNPPIE